VRANRARSPKKSNAGVNALVVERQSSERFAAARPPRLLVRTIFPKSHANKFGFAHDPGKKAADPD
jgi:hypothetical protein